MIDEKVSKGKILVSIIIIILLLGGAYVFIFGLPTKDKEVKENVNEVTKINEDEDYIYYDNIITLSDELQLYYMEPIINLDSKDAKDITAKYKNLVEKNIGTEEKNAAEENADVCYDSISKASIIDFYNYKYDKYVTLTTYSYEYICPSTNNEAIPAAYTFDISTGELLSQDELLKIYDVTESDVVSVIRAYLQTKSQEITSVSGQENNNILVEETIDNLEYNETYMIYINSEGKLMLNCLVITNELKYNEDIEIA